MQNFTFARHNYMPLAEKSRAKANRMQNKNHFEVTSNSKI